MSWPGGKDGAGVAQRLINEIPPHDVFVSAFLGDCAIMRRKRPARLNVGIDLDRANVERWAGQVAANGGASSFEFFCCDCVEWLRHRFGWYRVAASGGRIRRRWPATHDSATAAAVAGNGGGAHHFDAGNGGSDRDAVFGDGRSTAAGNGDLAGQVAHSGGAGPRRGIQRRGQVGPLDSAASAEAAENFVYVDPPYLIEPRRSRRRLYRHEFELADHERLLETLVSLPCLVMVSHYPCDLYARALGHWRSFTFAAQTRGGKKAVEQVWCNYERPAELHDARYLGLNKRQRERIRRRVRNWTAGLARMSPLERQAVLDAITGRG